MMISSLVFVFGLVGEIVCMNSTYNKAGNFARTYSYPNCEWFSNYMLPTSMESMVRNNVNFNAIRNLEGVTLLHCVVREGDVNKCRLLLDNGCWTSLRDGVGRTALHFAVMYGRLQVARLLLQRMQPNDLNKGDLAMKTALHMAVDGKNVDKEMVRLLLTHELSPDIQDKNGNTCMHLAAAKGDGNLARLLLSHKASMEIPNFEGELPINIAISLKAVDFVEAMMEFGWKLVQGHAERISLVKAVQFNCKRLVHSLINEYHVDLNQTDEFFKQTAIYEAAFAGYDDIVISLIKGGAQMIVDDAYGNRSPLHLSAYRGHINIMSILIENGLSIELLDDKNNTPLISAINGGQFEAVKYLLTKGARTDLKNASNSNPLHKAVTYGHMGIVEILLNKNVPMEAKDKYGNTCLTLAVANQQFEVVNFLLERGADKGVLDNRGKSLLHVAAMRLKNNIGPPIFSKDKSISLQRTHEERLASSCAIVHTLLNEGIPVDIEDGKKHTPLHLAAEYGNLPEVCILIERGAKIDPLDQGNRSPLMLAAHSNRMDVLKYLLLKGADISLRDEKGRTVLHEACRSSTRETVKLLLENGCDRNARDTYGLSVLHFAAIGGNHDIVEYITLEVDNLDVDDIMVVNSGHTPVHMAVKKNNVIACKLLVKKFVKMGLADILSQIDVDGKTSLHYAAVVNNLEIAIFLLETAAREGVSLKDKIDGNGSTCMHIAAKNGSVEFLQLLVQFGFSINIVNCNGKTPLDYAMKNNDECVNYMISLGATTFKPDKFY